MIRAFILGALALFWAVSLAAQDLSGLARVLPDDSHIKDNWLGKTEIKISLSQGVPHRVFTIDNPMRLVVDFREADWSGVKREMLLAEPGRISEVRFGTFQPGWSRLVAQLSEPMMPFEVGMVIQPESGQAYLDIKLQAVEMQEFIEGSGVPQSPSWTQEVVPPAQAVPQEQDQFVIVLDPGHGGIDPGAERSDVKEKDLMLSTAQGLRDKLVREGIEVVLTRSEDVFVALEQRVAIAHQVRADAFISLHADNLSQGGARGATVYTLSKEASDTATAHLAARHNRTDIIAGVDLTGSDDEVASVLLDLARQETEPRSAELAEVLVEGMATAGGPMNRRPLRHAGFSVLKSADIPSVLVEVGFLSSDRDFKNLRDPVWREGMIDGLADAILVWRDKDAERKPLVRN